MAESRLGPYVTGMISTGDDSGNAFGAGAKYEWLFHERFAADLHAEYAYDPDGEMGVILLGFGPSIVFPTDALTFWLGAGGLYGIPSGGDWIDDDPALGFYAAAGMRGAIADGQEWFAELMYADVDGGDNSKTTYYPWGYSYSSGGNIDLSAVGLNVGLLWRL